MFMFVILESRNNEADGNKCNEIIMIIIMMIMMILKKVMTVIAKVTE